MGMSRAIVVNIEGVYEERFDELKKLSKSKNDVHVVAKALAVYDFLIRGKSHENIVIIKSAKGSHEFKVT
jgi:hypothetical protein